MFNVEYLYNRSKGADNKLYLDLMEQAKDIMTEFILTTITFFQMLYWLLLIQRYQLRHEL